MSRIKIKDNSRIPKESLSGISLLTSKIADKTLEQLEKEGIFVFPEILRDADDITKDQMILQSVNNYYLSSNVMGFMGLGDEKLIVESRFSSNGQDFLFQYLLERVFDVPNIVDLETDANNDDRVFNLLVFIFPHYLKSAMRKGIFKTYVRKTYNDSNVKGTIDIARHIVKNTPWNVSPRSVNDMCKKGRIQGAIKEKGSWLIPDDSPKPMDGRVSNGKYIKKNMVAKAEVKSLPIGISDYVRAQEEYYYVDKTLLIKEFLDQKPLVSLFTRPRRFGKTLNMDMLRVFFEISDKNTSKYFADKNIWQCGEEYRSHQGKYPVIFLTFKDVKFDTWDATIDKIRGLLQEEYGRHQELLNSDKLSQYEKEYFTKIISATANEVELTSSLERLSKMLASHYDKAPVIIIDEYDTPIQEGYSKDFYDEIIGFMRNFFSGAFKDNKNLSYGFLTGILRIAQESIFSGLNNLTVNSVMDEEYDSFFGFTESEVKAMLSYYGVSDKEEELKDWYDGYLFGSEEIYNPWSVINYISKGCLPQAYWVNTGKNEILDDVLRVATDDITERLYDLLQGERVVARIDQNVVYRSLAEDPANIYSLLLVAGYLKTPKKELQADGSYLCEVSIPNREIAAVYKSEILSHFLQTGAITRTTANKIAESLYANDYKKLQSAIGEYMDKSISFFDGGAEGFYHGLMLGLIALMDNQYKIKSNRESGDGRFDVSLIPREKRYPGIILELKWKEKLSDVELKKWSNEALKQIGELRYDSEMKEDGITEILKFGIAFSGKKVCVRTE